MFKLYRFNMKIAIWVPLLAYCVIILVSVLCWQRRKARLLKLHAASHE